MSIHSTRLLAVFLPLVICHVTFADWHVWTVTDTRHVLRSEPPGNELAAKVAAARNEWVSFQILLRSDEAVKGVRVEAGELRGPDGAVSNRLYRQHQLHLEIGTYRNDAFKPDWYPDPLIPFEGPTTGKKLEDARFRAVPFDLPANESHGFWVDLYVPTETAPGEYCGTYRIIADGGKSLDVPIVLTVWNFTLPQTLTLVTAFGSPAGRIRDSSRQRGKAGKDSEPSDWQAVQTQCAQLLSEHRFNAVPPSEMLRPVAQGDGSFQIPAEQVRALREFVDRYHVNALDVPHPSSVIKDPEAERDKLRAWLAAFDRAAKELDRPHIVFYVYLKDEPNTREDYEYVQKWGRAIREAKSVVQVMVVEQTWTEPGQGGADSAWGDLYGAVDIWCPLFSLHHQDSAAKRQALGETVWAYTALCQGERTPWWHIDCPLLNYRVPAWMAWRDGMKGLLYWGGMSYWRETDDPWLHAPVYTGRGVFQQGDKGIRFNGEGSLVYPARAVGYDGVVSTIRLKALRDAIEDYEYLAILSRLGKSVEADRIVRRLTESWFQWDRDPAAYEKARAELAALIIRVAQPPSAGNKTTPGGGGVTSQSQTREAAPYLAAVRQFADQVLAHGRDFTRWVVEELTAWGKSAYRKQDNAFVPMLTDGTSMEGYVCKKDGYFGPKGRLLRAGHPGAAHLWLYAWTFRQSRDAFLWEMARNIVQGNGWGEIGATAQAGPALQFPNGMADPFLVMALLELHRAGGNAAFLEQAAIIGQNILKQRVHQGWFVPSQRHVFCRLGNHEAQALLHLAAALLGKPQSVPAFTGAVPFFHAEYAGQALRSYDTSIIYGKTR